MELLDCGSDLSDLESAVVVAQPGAPPGAAGNGGESDVLDVLSDVELADIAPPAVAPRRCAGPGIAALVLSHTEGALNFRQRFALKRKLSKAVTPLETAMAELSYERTNIAHRWNSPRLRVGEQLRGNSGVKRRCREGHHRNSWTICGAIRVAFGRLAQIHSKKVANPAGP